MSKQNTDLQGSCQEIPSRNFQIVGIITSYPTPTKSYKTSEKVEEMLKNWAIDKRALSAGRKKFRGEKTLKQFIPFTVIIFGLV